ncbi:hypothetical protein LMG29739_03127 [Paraburkholderia solisilvae]|uniref:Uncharacterized protein n=1 Tax=Paraburkholderia solisilvae TaxID=624376 RepID=A0A6J5E2L9_9BURK|nr:hypothetical protein LMG29739_03127 [Paraburkholderia solisilvae]
MHAPMQFYLLPASGRIPARISATLGHLSTRCFEKYPVRYPKCPQRSPCQSDTAPAVSATRSLKSINRTRRRIILFDPVRCRKGQYVPETNIFNLVVFLVVSARQKIDIPLSVKRSTQVFHSGPGTSHFAFANVACRSSPASTRNTRSGRRLSSHESDSQTSAYALHRTSNAQDPRHARVSLILSLLGIAPSDFSRPQYAVVLPAA